MIRFRLISLLLYLIGSLTIFAQTQQTQITIIGHRGSGLAPTTGSEPIGNTHNAIQQGIDQGADWIEIDIRQSKDGVLMVFHDSTIDRTTNGTGAFDSFTQAQLQALKLNVDPIERIPTLASVLQHFGPQGTRFVIDIKVAGIRQELESQLAQHLDDANVLLFGSYDILEEYINSPYRRGYTALYSEGNNRYRFWLGHSFLLKRCNTLGADTLVLPAVFLKKPLIKDAHERGIIVWSYGSNSPKSWSKSTGKGATGLIVDEVALAVKHVSKPSQ